MVEFVWRYCERGITAGWAAEPFNAASNLAFLIVAWLILRRSRGPRDRLVAVSVAAVFVGSTLFHGTALRLAEIADVVPIVVAVVILGRQLLVETIGLTSRGAWLALGIVGGMVASIALALKTSGCDLPAVVTGRLTPMASACLNGGWLYVPPAAALLVASGVAWHRKVEERAWLLAGAGVFVVALTSRSLDLHVCGVRPGPQLTLHAVWHILAAATLYLVWRALPSGIAPTRLARLG